MTAGAFDSGDEEGGAPSASDYPLADYRQDFRQLRSQAEQRSRTVWQSGLSDATKAAMVAQIVSGAQQLASHITQLYAASEFGAKFKPFQPGPDITERPGISKTDEFLRPAAEDSEAAALNRLETLVNTDLQLAKVRTIYSAFAQDMADEREPVKLYRRVPGGENPCALCEIASEQVYFTDDLMPIHDNCACDVEEDDGARLTQRDLARHHLIAVRQHGELGSVLTWKHQEFTGPEDLPNPTEPRPLPGQGAAHEERLARNRERVAQYRAQRYSDQPEPQYHAQHGIGSSHVRLAAVADEARPFDWNTASVQEMVGHMKTTYADRIDTFSVDRLGRNYFHGFEDARPENAREALQALDEILTRHPALRVGNVGVEKMSGDLERAIAIAMPGDGANTQAVMFNRKYMVGKRQELVDSFSTEIGRKFHAPNAYQNPFRYIVFHEFGHVMDNAGGRRARESLIDDLVGEYRKSPQANAFQERFAADPMGTSGVGERFITPEWRAAPPISFQEAEFGEWMRPQVTGYSMADEALPGDTSPTTGMVSRAMPNRAEMLAQAFADVEFNGDAASDLHKFFYDRLVTEAEVERGPAFTGEIAAAAPPPEAFGQSVWAQAKANGGITIDLEGGQPASGYAYAPAKDTERAIPLERFTVEDVDKYIDDHQELLSQPGNHLGIWEEDGQMYLDVSTVGSASAETIADAQAANQLGVYDLSHDVTINIGTIDTEGKYSALDEASNLHYQHQRQVGRADES